MYTNSPYLLQDSGNPPHAKAQKHLNKGSDLERWLGQVKEVASAGTV
jgi:hypothetical protein